MMESPAIVTVENVVYPESDLKILLKTGQTVIDVKYQILHRRTHLIMNDLCLLHGGRLLQDHESIHDLLNEEQLEMTTKSLKQEQSITLDLICSSPDNHSSTSGHSYDSLSSDKHTDMTVDLPFPDPNPPLRIDPASLSAAKAYISNHLSSSSSSSSSSHHTHMDTHLPRHLESLNETLSSLLLLQQQDESITRPHFSGSFAHTLQHNHHHQQHQQHHQQQQQQHVYVDGRGCTHLAGVARAAAGGGGGARAGVMAGGQPLALLLQEEEEREALPRLIRFPVLFRLAFTLMLFGRDYDTFFLAAVSFLYYFYEVGLWGFLYRRFCPHILPPPPAPRVPPQPAAPDAAAGDEGQNQGDVVGDGGGEGVRHRLPQGQGAAAGAAGGGGMLGGLGHLVRRVQTLAQAPPGPSLLPRRAGAVMDVWALLVAFFGSLLPSWNAEQ